MMIGIYAILMVLAVVCWFLAAIGVPSSRVNLTALGLFLMGLAVLLGGVKLG